MTTSESAILIFGATRGTGLEAARLLRQRGRVVTATVRESSDTEALVSIGANVLLADVFDSDNISELLKANDYAAIVLSLSGQKGEPQRPDREGIKIIVDAAAACGIKRIIMVTAIGCADSRPAVAPKVIEFLGPVLDAKTEAEDYLQNTDLDITILRPGGLTDEPASGTAILSEDHMLMGVASRADVGRLIVECLDQAATIGGIYHTVDPEIGWQPPLQRGEDISPKQ